MDYCLKAIIQESIENMSHGADSSAPYEFEKVGRIMAEVAFGINAFRTSGGSAGGMGERMAGFMTEGDVDTK